MDLKTITLQFEKKLDVDAERLNDILVNKFHDIVKTRISNDPRKSIVKTLTLYCDRCSADEVLKFIRNGNLKDFVMSDDMNTTSIAPQQNENEVDVNTACNSLGKAFQNSFEKIANLDQTLNDMQNAINQQNEQIQALQRQNTALEQLVSANSVEQIKSEAKDEVDTLILEKTEEIDNKIAELDEKNETISSLQNRCDAIENYLESIPQFEKGSVNGNNTENEGNEQPTVTRPRPKE